MAGRPDQRRPGRWVYGLALASLLALLYLRLIPFQFVFDGRLPGQRITVGPTSLRDVPLNILLVAPLAFGAAGALARQGQAWDRIWRRVIGCGLALSVVLEAAQLFMPARVPSVADVIANAVGLALGLLIYQAWTGGFARTIARAATLRNLALLTSLYLIGLALLLWTLFDSVRLAPWDDTYPLLLGNEADGERPWRGRVDTLDLYARGLDAEEADAALQGTIPAGAFATYRFDGAGPYPDALGRLPDLTWAGSGNGGIDGEVGPQAWLAAGPPDTWTAAARAASAFSVILRFEPAGADQRGPARLFTVSADRSHRNLTIGQLGEDIVIRLRTAISGDNGRRPEIVISGGMAPTSQALVLIYDAPRLSVYRQDAPAQGLSLAPGVAFFAGFMTSPEWIIRLGDSPGLYDWLFLAVAAAPALLGAFVVAWARRTADVRQA